jgi:ferric-dicitrate binding protein FerR (iron transport regulator)
MAVRGTEFSIEQNQDDSTTLFLYEGAIEASSAKLDRPVTLKANERLLIKQDGSIDGPKSLNAETVVRWWETAP